MQFKEQMERSANNSRKRKMRPWVIFHEIEILVTRLLSNFIQIKPVTKKRWMRAQLSENEYWREGRTAKHLQEKIIIAGLLGIDLGNIYDKRVLEVGPACNSMREIIKGKPIQYTIIEPGKLLECDLNFYRGKGVEIINLPLEEYKTDGKFDLIICINVLQHVIDPRVCLEKMLDLLAQGGELKIFEFLFEQTDIGHPHVLTDKFFKSYFNTDEITFLSSKDGIKSHARQALIIHKRT